MAGPIAIWTAITYPAEHVELALIELQHRHCYGLQ
jgi:hypothetical protein